MGNTGLIDYLKSEMVHENAIQSNYQGIFGPDSFYFDIKKEDKVT